MLSNEDKNKEINKEEVKLLGKKKEREKIPNYYTKEEAYNIYDYRSKNIPKDIELIKSYSKSLYQRLNNSPIEIINILVSPITKFNDYFLEIYNNLLVKIQDIKTSKKKIIKFMYNNGIISNEPIELPSDYNMINNEINNAENNIEFQDNNNDMEKGENTEEMKKNNNIIKKVESPYFKTLNAREVWESLKDYKWEGLIKIIILFGDNGFCKQIIKNIDCYHYNYIIMNLNTITQEEKIHFNYILNNIYSFDDIISCLKQDIYEHSTGKKEIKEISENFNDYNNLLKRYSHYNYNTEQIYNSEKPNIICFNLYNKNIININKNDLALYDPNSCSKTFISMCYTAKIKKELNDMQNIPNFMNPKLITNNIGVELVISNNIYNIINHDYNEENLNIHINNLTLGKKMIGYSNSKINKNIFNQESIINNILLNFAICDYICDLFNMRLYSKNINLNIIEIHLYEFTNYNIQYLIAKEYLQNYSSKYDQDLLNCFSHFSFCISYGKLLIDNIREYNGKIFSFIIYKDNDNDLNNEEYTNIFKFMCYHKCNKYCDILGLKNLNKNFFEINEDNIEFFKNKKICEICKSIFKIDNKYNYKRDNLCLCFECYNKIYESKYIRACAICGEKFEYFYKFYILQRIETPSLCKECEKIKNNEDSDNDIEDKNDDNISEDAENNNNDNKKENNFIDL